MIIKETYDLILSKQADIYSKIKIEKVVVGAFFTAVRLSTGHVGIAHTEIDSAESCTKKHQRNFGNFSPGKIMGNTISDFFEYIKNIEAINKVNILNSVNLAVLNAISAKTIAEGSYHIIEDKDPIDLVNLNGKKTICLVGGFQSYINKISSTNNKLYVLELNENALEGDQKKYYQPASEAKNIFAQSDIIIITGSTLANNTLDELLTFIPESAEAILVGPSSSFIPDVLFSHNIKLIGSTKIIDSEKMFTIVSEGGSGYHLFQCCAKKICILSNGYKTNQ